MHKKCGVAQFSSGSASIGPKTRTPGGELGQPSFHRPQTDNSSQNSLPLCYLLVLLCRPCLFAVQEFSGIAPVEVVAQESAMADNSRTCWCPHLWKCSLPRHHHIGGPVSRRVLCINVWGRDNEEPCQHMVTWVCSHTHIFPSLPFVMRLPLFCASCPLAAPATLCMIAIIAVDNRPDLGVLRCCACATLACIATTYTAS